MEGQFTALQNMLTQRMENILNQRMQVISNIQAEMIHREVDQMTQDNAQLQRQVSDLTRNVQSIVVAKVALISTTSMIATPLLVISDPEVAAAAADRHSPRLHGVRNPTLQILHTPQAPPPAPAPTPAITYSHPPTCPSMATVRASGASIFLVQQWTTVFCKGKPSQLQWHQTQRKAIR